METAYAIRSLPPIWPWDLSPAATSSLIGQSDTSQPWSPTGRAQGPEESLVPIQCPRLKCGLEKLYLWTHTCALFTLWGRSKVCIWWLKRLKILGSLRSPLGLICSFLSTPLPHLMLAPSAWTPKQLLAGLLICCPYSILHGAARITFRNLALVSYSLRVQLHT